ncbi:MAG: hypothetical protein QOF78_1286 [Phycisphaerales bacterium]|jgi:hypothetical protein|nr:hypothetical protein [Phycisphaerales bacterium]
MPRIVDYANVSDRLLGRGFASLYHNSGAFGFPRDADVKMLGWIGPTDATIRAEMKSSIRQVPPPHAANLAEMLVKARRHLPGEAWLMPKSHWHFELHDGHPALLEALLPEIGIDPRVLRDRNDGSAIAFAADEDERLRRAVERLLDGMRQSDFSIAFPDAGAAAICTLHHHRQIWWQATSAELIELLEGS